MLRRLKESPAAVTLLIGIVLLSVLVARGMDYGPLQSDTLIFRAWFNEYGAQGFGAHYLEVNQRHILAGAFVTFVLSLAGERDWVYNIMPIANRVLQGALLAGIVFQLARRRLLAICAGLALTLSPVRVPELYQGLVWGVESTLTILLASSYAYLLSLRRQTWRATCYVLAVILYAVSVLIYEAGLPWIAVNFLLGWFVRDTLPRRRRFLRTFADAVPFVLCGGAVTFLVLVALDPWTGLQPHSGSFVTLLVRHLGTLLTFPALWISRLGMVVRGGYLPLLMLFSVGGVAGMVALARTLAPDEDSLARRDFSRLGALGLVMLLASALVGASTQGASNAYLDRITFGRAVGIALIYVTLFFAVVEWSRVRWPRLVAAALIGGVLVGPGVSWFWVFQDYAQFSRAEIDRMTTTTLNIRPLMMSPLHLVIVTDPDWPVSYFVDSSDLVLHEVQQNLWQMGGDATLDILHTGAFPDEYATVPGTCDTESGVASSGICLGSESLYSSRWAYGETHPYEDIVVVRYDHDAGEMTILPAISLDDLTDYNVTTAGARVLNNSGDRLLVPVSGG